MGSSCWLIGPPSTFVLCVSVSLLRAGGNNKNIILSPMPRYISAKCCSDKTHLSNFGKKNYANAMGKALVDIHFWIDDLAHGKRIKNYEVVCSSLS